ncbi:protein arginine N-methyltransferase [Vigna angularis]|uniref:Protein arginine N-methyltransferase n=1 Tax=Phaseolus angularis TaxID=3914 RepID=A0A8T0JJL3_PHAAN|nr:protein arginine N-methyltransferase [Vigna angularis]
MASIDKQKREEEKEPYRMEEEEDEDIEEEEGWDDWEGERESEFACLFCDSQYSSCSSLFDHCASLHHFDFHAIRASLKLDFYASFKLINFVRSQVSSSFSFLLCFFSFFSFISLVFIEESEFYFKMALSLDVLVLCLSKYLIPFLQDDSLLYSFGECDEEVDDGKCDASFSIDHLNRDSSSKRELINGKDSVGHALCSDKDPKKGPLIANSQNHIAKHIKKVNESYFGSYSSFGIHREMLSDKVRMDAYGQAILKNPSLLNGAVVMDVGCGTGILSLFSAQAGASRVIAVEASAKMAAVASQVAKDNGLWWNKTQSGIDGLPKRVIEVVHGMVEEIDKTVELQPHSVDVLLSEWMGYCLLYESMLGSVLYARDRWLKPGGAILPDTATIFVAGFGKGATSLPFWDNVCGFDMSCIGKELVMDAAQIPIVDVLDSQDLVTSSAILQSFDLATMKPNEVDFTATTTLELKPSASATWCWCYGAVLWFETGFTRRFCRETPAVLSTSPYTPRTHWSQTILTFREPIAMGFGKEQRGKLEAIGTEVYPAVNIDLRISIVRSTEHRSIDISLEATGVSPDGLKRSWPAQLFNLQ